MGGGPVESPRSSIEELDDHNINLSNEISLGPTMNEDLSEKTPSESMRVRLLYCKSKVYIHLSQDLREQISGYISLVERSPSDYLLMWIPELMLSSSDRESFYYVESHPDHFDDDDKVVSINLPYSSILTTSNTQPALFSSSSTSPYSQYAFSIPVVKIYSLAVYPPSLAKWYGCVIINMQGGTSLSPLWFHDDELPKAISQKQRNQMIWGGVELIERLARLAVVVPSELENDMFLVNPTNDDVTTHCAALVAGINSYPPYISGDNYSGSSTRSPKLHPLSEAIQMESLATALKEARWNILEGFSRITTLGKHTAAQLRESPITRSLFSNPSSQNEVTHSTVEDYDPARVYLAKFAAQTARDAEHFEGSENGKLPSGPLHVGEGQSNLTGEVWEEETGVGVFEIIEPRHTRTSPLTAERWVTFFDVETGKLVVPEKEIREIVFKGTMEHDIRIEAWKFFLGIYPWDSTESEREQLRKDKVEEYFRLKRKWWESTEMQETQEFREQKHRIDKDVHRTDRTVPFFAGEDMPNPDPDAYQGTNENLEKLKDILLTYNFYNTELGYVQGMSDLLAPIFAVMGEEVMAFWGFVGFMEKMESNFSRDQSGMHHQLRVLNQLIQFMDPPLYKHLEQADALNLFFCFRWLLIWFKREFKWDEVMPLWEVLWSDHLTNQFHLFVAFAILDQHRYTIIDHLRHFDEILKYINDLAMTINLDQILQRAEILYYQFRSRIQTIDERRAILEAELKEQEILSRSQRRNGKDIENELRKLPVVRESLRELLGDSKS